MGDPRPGFEAVEPPHRRWYFDWLWPVGGLVAGLLVVLVPGDSREHALGGTDLVTTTVTAVRPNDACDSGSGSIYELTWRDGQGESHESELRACGTRVREVGDRVQVWVSPDIATAEDEGPVGLWLWVVGGLTVFGVLAGLLRQWRSRVMGAAVARGERWRRRRRTGT